MSFWSLVKERYSRQQIEGWGSIRKTLYILLPLLIYYLVHDAVEIFLWAGLDRMMQAGSPAFVEKMNTYASTVRVALSALAIFIAVGVLYPAARAEIILPEKENKRTEGRKGKRRAAYVVLAITAVSSSLCLNMLLNVVGLVKTSAAFSETVAVQYGVEFGVGILLYGILSPLAEEVLFRGVIYNRMKRCFELPVAVLISALLFGCYHGNLVQGIYGFLMGILIAFTYEKYGSFAAPFLFHAVSNIGVYTITNFGGFGRWGRVGAIVGMLTSAVIAVAGICWMRGNSKEEKACEKG